MLPEWFGNDSCLSADPELRKLELQYVRDDIRMRRWVLIAALVAQALSYIGAALAPSLATFGIAAGATAAVPLGFYFTTRRLGRGSVQGR